MFDRYCICVVRYCMCVGPLHGLSGSQRMDLKHSSSTGASTRPVAVVMLCRTAADRRVDAVLRSYAPGSTFVVCVG